MTDPVKLAQFWSHARRQIAAAEPVGHKDPLTHARQHVRFAEVCRRLALDLHCQGGTAASVNLLAGRARRAEHCVVELANEVMHSSRKRRLGWNAP